MKLRGRHIEQCSDEVSPHLDHVPNPKDGLTSVAVATEQGLQYENVGHSQKNLLEKGEFSHVRRSNRNQKKTKKIQITSETKNGTRRVNKQARDDEEKQKSDIHETNLDMTFHVHHDISESTMQKSSLSLNNKVKALEEEVEFWKNKYSNSSDEVVRAKNASKVELQTKTDKIKSLEEEVKKINAQHEKVLDKKQITLDSLGNTISSQKKDISKCQQQIKQLQDEISELKDTNKTLLDENEQLKADNKAHVEIATSVLTFDEDAASKIDKLTEENEQLRIEIEKKDFESADLKKNTADNVKVADKSKELSSEKTRNIFLSDQLHSYQTKILSSEERFDESSWDTWEIISREGVTSVIIILWAD